AGGKGINVARATKVLKGNALLTGIMGGHTAVIITDDLNMSGINNDFCIIDKETRTCLIILDKNRSTHTVINEEGPLLSDKEIDTFINKFISITKYVSYVVLSGSIPKTLDRTIYDELITICNKNNIKCVVDASRKALIDSIKARPFIIKPNIFEISEIFEDMSIKNNAMKENFSPLIKRCEDILAQGPKNIIVTLGELGAILINKDFIFRVVAPKIDVINPIASGDSATAALTMELENNKTLEEALISAVAAGTANATIGGLRFSFELYSKLRAETKGYYIERN
ncbi:MAG: 1-phosphofructokinase family hexose kinase, partial [Vampirovibrionia bacterium]